MRRAYRRKYHFIYKTTCKVTNKYYIGMHSTDNLEDGYVGSGKRLWYSINKHGKENHVCEILEHLPDRVALKKREAELVNETSLADPMCMNLKHGGDGGFDHVNGDNANITHEHTHLSSMGRKAAAYFANNAEAHAERSRRGIHALREKFANGELKASHGFKGKKHTDETKRRMAEAASKRVGANNSQHNTCWVFSLIEKVSKKITKDELQNYLSDGWQVGRKMKF